MKRFALHRACSFVAASVLVCSPVIATAQSNPFVPPAKGSGLSREEVAEIVRREAAKNNQTPAPANGAAAPGAPGGVANLPTQPGGAAAPSAPGAPGGSPIAGPAGMAPVGANGQMPAMSVAVESDPIAELLANGGSFVGCVGDTPVFKDKVGRRAYFTTKELRKSHEARRFTRC